MFCHTQRSGNLSEVVVVFAALVLLIGLAGCASLDEKYAGYTVTHKEFTTEVRKVPIRVTSCVTPQGRLICERRYGAINECTLACKTPQNTWIERPEGYGGYEDKTFTEYFVTMQSPAGKTERIETSEVRYNQVSVGQILGTALNEPAAVRAPKAPARQKPEADIVPARVAQAPSTAPSAQQDSPAASARISLADAQRKLAVLGFDPGPSDGAMGPKTASALRTFQKSRNIPISGQLDDATMRELMK